MAMHDLNKHVTNLMKNYTKCLTGLHPQKRYNMQTGQKNCGTTCISVKRTLKNGDQIYKNIEKITTGGLHH